MQNANAPDVGNKDGLAGGPEPETMAYAGRKKCGCLVAATVDDGKTPKETAEDVADMIRRGYTVERVPCKDLRLKRCRCGEQSSARQVAERLHAQFSASGQLAGSEPANNQALPQGGQ